MIPLSLEALQFAYPGQPPVLHGIDAVADTPTVIGIVGPNGAGKSTLLDLIAGQRTPTAGQCTLGDQPVHRLPRELLCRQIAHVPQLVPADVPLTVEQVVLTGRLPHGSGLFESEADYAAMEQALRHTRLTAFRGRPFAALSGGEKQRVLLAAAVCQAAPILLLDEPSAHLDPENEAAMWELFGELKQTGHLVLVVTHHLALAAQHCDRIWLLDQGRLAADGNPCAALEPARLEQVFRVPFHWHQNPEGRVFLTYGH
ncbi:MAG: ABC transporter ATP-binding protein [Acidobacteriota bacterium]